MRCVKRTAVFLLICALAVAAAPISYVAAFASALNNASAQSSSFGFARAGGDTVVSSVTRLDLRQGRITGDKAYYYLNIPDMWQGYLLADREKDTRGGPLEKLIFYYQPQDSLSKPVPILSIIILNKNTAAAEGYTRFLETRRYYFTYANPERVEFSGKTDQAIYDQIMSRASDSVFLTSLVELPSDDEKIFSNTIWVNGRQIKAEPFKEGIVTYVPIRGVCESLGYYVYWIAPNRAISLSRGREYVLLLTNSSELNGGYPVVIRKNVAYISTSYFPTQLHINVEIDGKSNVSFYAQQ